MELVYKIVKEQAYLYSTYHVRYLQVLFLTQPYVAFNITIYMISSHTYCT